MQNHTKNLLCRFENFIALFPKYRKHIIASKEQTVLMLSFNIDITYNLKMQLWNLFCLCMHIVRGSTTDL